MTASRLRRAALAVAAVLIVNAVGGPPGAAARAIATGASGSTSAAPAKKATPAGTAAPRTTSPSTAKKPATRPRAAAARPAAKPASGRTSGELAREARSMEDLGFYAQAAERLAELRGRVMRDADLELSLALDHARGGRPDSAAAILWSPVMAAALNDTGPLTRYNEYPWPREGSWLNGKFDGWHWYVARARAEVALTLRRWDDAADAARIATRARGSSGKEWLILALAAGRAGHADESRAAALRAVTLDPILPEAQYVQGLWEWRDGKRAAAAERFRWALAADSAYGPAALSLARVRLPVPPDSLPIAALTGLRAAGLLASPMGPKIEEFKQMDSPAAIVSRATIALPDSLRDRWKQIQITPVVLVNERGRAVLVDLPWTHPMPGTDTLTGIIVASMPMWQFRPAIKDGRPHPVWAAVDVAVNP